MTGVHRLSGAVGSIESDATYAAYHAAIADSVDAGEGLVRHRLRPEVGDGTIEVTSLRGGFQIVRYDVAFAARHRIGYDFPDDHFELEHCLDGRMRVREAAAGTDDLHAGSVALSPRCAVDGTVAYAGGQRYRAVSVAGTWTGLETYLGGLGVAALPCGSDRLARERYLGRAAAWEAVARPLTEIFTHRRLSPGRSLFLESRLVAALGALIDEHAAADGSAAARDLDLEDHEIAALRRVPELLWRERHAPPTLAALARASSMSVRRLVTGFRVLHGTSVMEFHRRHCLDQAAALLVETEWPVARIGHEVGYASSSNFGYAFRRDRGISPARFRHAYR